MRQSRSKVRKESKGKKLSFIIIFLILLPSISILLGYLGTKYVIKPILSKNSVEIKENTFNEIPREVVKPDENIQPNSENIQPTNEKETYLSAFEIKGLDIFSMQVGSFSTKENAQVLVDELKSKEMGAYIWYNERYKVMTISMLDRESIEPFIRNVKQEYEGAFVTTRSVPIKTIKYAEADAQCSMLLESQNKRLIEIFKDVSESIIRSKEKPIHILIQKQIDDLEDMKDKLKKEKPTKHIEAIYHAFVKLVDDFIQGLQDGLKNDTKSCMTIQNTLMKGLYQYSDFVTNNEY
ncbi:SPOR domain-containing protein [Marinisporobacter balticus]|uniref:Sporulation related protein n=1 Tax=Marinisporobacter balticus TaxID=2018667 RepID=A0A4R2L163_9FIRM|nr:SPOR domain-containing protein [Marinisporobacter balticus]TCO80003.1 sporulation related protein [Marinisporobacter balticus]